MSSLNSYRGVLLCSVVLLLTCVTGCSQAHPDVVPVTGRVTINGNPIENLILIMQPTNSRASQGTTDSNGNYEMWFTADTKGVKVGAVGVWIDSMCADMMEGETLARFKKIPKTYFTTFQELEIDPTSRNVFDVDIKL